MHVKALITFLVTTITFISNSNADDLVREFDDHTQQLYYLGLSTDFLFSSSYDGSIRRWRLNSAATTLSAFGTHTKAALGLTIRNDTLVSAGSDRLVKFWSISSQTLQSVISFFNLQIRKAVIVPYRNDLLVACADNGSIFLWSMPNNAVIRHYPYHRSTVMFDCVMYNSTMLITAASHGYALFFNIYTGRVQWNFTIDNAHVTSIAFYRGTVLLSSVRNVTRQWSLASGQIINTFPVGHFAICNHRNFLYIASGVNAASNIREYSLANGSFIRQGSAHTGGRVSAISGRGRYLYTGGTDSLLMVWNLGPGPAPLPVSSSLLVPAATLPPMTILEPPDDASRKSTTAKNQGGDSDESNESQATFLIVGLVSGAVLILSACVLVVRYRKRHDMHTTTGKITESTTALTTDSEGEDANRSMMHQMTAMTSMTTVVADTPELAIPAFLYCEMGKDYSLGKKLMRGAAGAIHECKLSNREIFDRAGAVQVVGKVIQTIAKTEAAARRVESAFYQELSLMWRFRNSPHFVKVFAFSQHPKCLLMKYYPLGDLKGFIDGKHHKHLYTSSVIVSLLKQICLGISEMHDASIAHCDIKPANILLDESPFLSIINGTRTITPFTVIVSDFGIARILKSHELEVEAFAVSNVKGASLIYAPPEALARVKKSPRRVDDEKPGNTVEDGDEVWKAGDVYSVGVTLLEMLIRKRAWQ